MAHFRCARTPGATYFFTVVTYRRQPVLTREPVYLALKTSLRAVKQQYPFTIEALVLMPDHLHCLWKLPEGDGDYARRWSLIKRLTTQQLAGCLSSSPSRSAERRRESGLWQRRFWEHQIRDERDFERHLDYIHWNPVKHGHVDEVAHWPYSSFHRYVDRGIYPKDWGGRSMVEVDADCGEPV